MIQITQLKLSYFHSTVDLENKIRKTLKLPQNQSFTYKIVKKSIDARKKPEIYSVYSCYVSCDNEASVVKKVKTSSVTLVKPKNYILPDAGEEIMKHAPLIIGAGPAGLFSAFVLAEASFHPILIERVKRV